ncbi:c-type cytochrome [sulfur-oxidizing endosymbiont of Gigantopelta aegis]|uniref:c-type cytochrome n=1 Tax=sulfur-oxidizing endosymbiont of Gigantopelta aegis TaxID=2794934 RepID=UPI0018DE6C17|nr:cytochrome c [sulfur-oxidizing endosymbiont of Gigantopelta aegis]
MKTLLLAVATSTLLLAGCSKDFAPETGASGEDIFKNACLDCHKAIEGKDNIHYELTSENKNVDYIASKITEGSLMMPKFPNITGDSLKAVSLYALEHSGDK